jgi:lipase
VTELQLRTYGPADGRAVLALHGVTAHAARWRVLAEALPELRAASSEVVYGFLTGERRGVVT